MNIFRIVLKSLRQHLFSTVITALCIALAGGLLMSVWVVRDQSRQTFTRMDSGFDAVLGTRSSQLQLVLNSIFHLENSPGNIEFDDFEKVKEESAVALAVPISVGDSYRGFRVVGTTLDYFQKAEFAKGRKHAAQKPGRFFDEAYREAVVGSFVAQRLGLKYGDHFHPSHGVVNDAHEHEEEYVVVGILEPSNTPADRVIWIPLEGLQRMSGHREESHNELSAVLLKFRSPIAGKQLQMRYNDPESNLTLAWPIGTIIAQLFDKVSWFDRVLELLSYLIAVVATASILASIYNSMNERRREIAIMRALGAHRGTIFSTIVLESATIAALGMVIAFGFYLLIVGIVAQVIRAQTGIVLEPLAYHPVMLWAPVGMIALAGLAGLVPAFKAYRTDVAANLIPVS